MDVVGGIVFITEMKLGSVGEKIVDVGLGVWFAYQSWGRIHRTYKSVSDRSSDFSSSSFMGSH